MHAVIGKTSQRFWNIIDCHIINATLHGAMQVMIKLRHVNSSVLVNPLFLGCSELCVLLCEVVLVSLKLSDLVNRRLVWRSATAWTSAAAPAAMSMSATNSSSDIIAPASTTPTPAELSNVAHVGRVLFKVTDKVSKQHQTHCEGLFFFPHGQHLADHGLGRIVLDSSQQMMDLLVLVKATLAVLHQVLGNGVLLNMGISISDQSQFVCLLQ